jgi:hypothetical protein
VYGGSSMYPVYCFCVVKAVVQVPLEGCLYATVTLGFTGEVRMLSYVAGRGYWACTIGKVAMKARRVGESARS